MKKIICDRCGKEIDTLVRGIQGLDVITKSLNASTMTNSVNYNITSYGSGSTFHQSYDLCKDCQNDLDDWLNGSREEEK